MSIYTSCILYIAAALSLAGCTGKAKEKPKEQSGYCLEAAFKKDLKLQPVASEKITAHLQLTGVVEANPEQVIHFKSLYSGVVANTFFSLGDRVTKGQVLAEISSTESSSLTAELTSLASQIKVAEAKLHSTTGMYKDGIASQREINEAQSELDVLQAEKARVESNRSLYSASNSKNVFQIKAPGTGIITAKEITTGMQITGDGDDVLFTIANLENVWVMANIYATDVSHITEGMEVEVSTVSYPGEVFTGKISVIAPVLDEASKVVKARIVLHNNHQQLKPGMLTDIKVLSKTNTEAISIPVNQVIFSNNENYVVVYKDDCHMEVRNIHIIARNNGYVFVKDGVAADEQLVAENQLLLFNRLTE